MTTIPASPRPTLSTALRDLVKRRFLRFESTLEPALRAERAADCEELATLLREHADTEDPEPEDATVLPPLPELDALPNIPEETT